MLYRALCLIDDCSAVRTLLKIGLMINKADTAVLDQFLDDPARPEGTFKLHELQGFLYVVACSPEHIPPGEWLAEIANGEDMRFQSAEEAEQITGLIFSLFNQVNEGALERSRELPDGVATCDNLSGNFEDSTPICQWSKGFVIGHGWLEEVWDSYAIEEMDEELGSAAMVLSFFSSRKLAELFFQETMTPQSKRKPATKFEDFAEKVKELFPSALASYAHMGRSIAEALATVESSRR